MRRRAWWERPVRRREFLGTLGLGLGALALGAGCGRRSGARPDVLFVSIDDLNDWVGVLGGHPQARTPHLDALAARGVLFANAHCDAPACLPSRTAVLTGLRPSTSGAYGSDGRSLREALPDVVTLPQRFRADGYRVLGAGKVFHRPDPASWDVHFEPPTPAFDSAEPLDLEGPGARRADALRFLGWDPANVPEERLIDPQLVAWVASRLETLETPFFLACGLHRPHTPWRVPRRFFDLHPLDAVALPPRRDDDLDDVPRIARRLGGGTQAILGPARDRELTDAQLRQVLRAYLASISFADEMIGRLVAALDASPNAPRTIVVVWSDNGLQLGQKSHFGKARLWETATRVPLIVVAPGVSVAGGVCRRPVNLVDLFPTLVELCDLPAGSPTDGASLVPLLRDPDAGWSRAALTTNGVGNHAVRSERWRYIRYRNGAEELYDHDSDPNEWHNLAGDPALAGVKAELARWMPEREAPPAGRGRTG